MSSRARMLTILDCFSDEAPAWTTEDLIGQLGCSKPTAYRYVKELCNAGLLLRIGGGLYVLGPRILELDLQIRRSDPLLRVARPAMRDLVEQTGGDVLLANVYGNQVMNVHREDGPTPAVISYDRGRPHPLFRGSTSKAVLPFLPAPSSSASTQPWPTNAAVRGSAAPGASSARRWRRSGARAT